MSGNWFVLGLKSSLNITPKNAYNQQGQFGAQKDLKTCLEQVGIPISSSRTMISNYYNQFKIPTSTLR